MARDLFGQMTGEREIRGERYAGIERARTLDAVLFFDGEKEHWLPLSQVHVEQNGPARLTAAGNPETPVTVTIPDWLAEKRGMV